MKTIHLEVTSRCNLSCPYCYARSRSAKDRPAEYWIALIQECACLGESHFVVTGGEPLVRKDIESILGAARDAGICELYTNGTESPSRFQKILDFVDKIRISLDGANPQHYSLTRDPAKFSAVIENIRQTIRTGMPHAVQMTITNTNLQYTEELVAFLEELGVERIHLSPELTFSASDREIMRIITATQHVVALSRLHPTVVRESPVGFQHPRYPHVPGAACGVFKDRFFVTSDGFLAGCPLLSGPTYQRENLFHILMQRHAVEEAFGRASMEWELTASESVCTRCVHVVECGGWCPGVRGGLHNRCQKFQEAKE